MTANNGPSTVNITTHGLSIFKNSEAIGNISDWGSDQRQDVTQTFELGQVTDPGDGGGIANPGEAYENVPGNVTGTTIRIARFDVYKAKFEEAFKASATEANLYMLCNQKTPLTLREYWKAPDASMNFTYLYYGFWFQSLGKKAPATGDRLARVDASGMYRVKRPG